MLGFTPCLLYSQGRSPQYPLNRGLDVSQKQSVCFGEEKCLLSLPEVKACTVQQQPRHRTGCTILAATWISVQKVMSSCKLHWQYILFTWIDYKIIYRLIGCRLARCGGPWAQVCWTAPSVGWIVFQNLSLQTWMCSRNQSHKYYSCPAWWDS